MEKFEENLIDFKFSEIKIESVWILRSVIDVDIY